MPLAPLATIDDYMARHGTPDDPAQVATLIGDAESLVREVAGLTISLAEDVEVAVAGEGTGQILLPEFPVVAVESVAVDAVPLATTDYRWWEWGAIDRLYGAFELGPRRVTVVYTHGWDPVPSWITALVCGMVKRSLLDHVAEGIRSETYDEHTVTFASPEGGAVLWLTSEEQQRLRGLRGPVIA